jgi:hypothetical protein
LARIRILCTGPEAEAMEILFATKMRLTTYYFGILRSGRTYESPLKFLHG